LARTIDELEKRTKQLEQEYENLIKEKQEIVQDMAKVEDKVTRSKNLLDNLSSEKTRW
jgi:dynein heavy chain 1